MLRKTLIWDCTAAGLKPVGTESLHAELQLVIGVEWKLMIGNACYTLALCIIGSLTEETCEKLEIWIENTDKRLLEISQLHPRVRNNEVPVSSLRTLVLKFCTKL